MDIFIVGIGDMIILSDAPCPCLNEPFLEGSALNKAAVQQASSEAFVITILIWINFPIPQRKFSNKAPAKFKGSVYGHAKK